VPIKFRCSECTQKLSIDDAFAGKRVACVRCGSKQRVPQVSSPELSQPAARSRKPSPPAPPERPPREQKADRPASQRRQSLRSEAPRHEPVWFEEVQPSENEPSVEPAPTKPEPIQPVRAVEEPTVPELAVPELVAPELVVPELVVPESAVPEAAALEPAGSDEAFAEPSVFEQPPPAQTLTEKPAPEVIWSPSPRSVPRRGRAAAGRESSLVPPYKKLDVEEMIDMTAMVDIVFFLLIFFLVTSMHALDSTIPMPAPDPQKGAAREPKSVAAIDADDSYVVVRIDRNDRISVEGSDVRNERDLLFKLRDLRLSSAHPEKLLVVGHGDATHGTVVMVLDTGRELGMDQVKLTTQDQEE